MAVSTEHTKDILMGDGVNTKFPFTFQVIDKKQIRCLKVLASGEEVEVLHTEFEITLHNEGSNGGEINYPLIGLALEEGCKFIIYRQTEIKQNYTPPNGQVFDAIAIKTEVDRLTMQNQEQAEGLSRSVQTSMGSDAKPEEYLDNVNEMLINARKLQEEAVRATSQNIIDVGVQVEIATEKASQATEQAMTSTQKAKEAIENADRAEYWANNAEVQSQSVYQEKVVLESPLITLHERKCRYVRNVLAGDAFTIDKSALKQTDKDITFELIINMPIVVAFNLAAITSIWMNGFVPDMSEVGQHWIAFLSQDGGLTWRASYEGRF